MPSVGLVMGPFYFEKYGLVPTGLFLFISGLSLDNCLYLDVCALDVFLTISQMLLREIAVKREKIVFWLASKLLLGRHVGFAYRKLSSRKSH